MHSNRSLTTGWEHFRTVGFHLEKAGFLENRKRIIEDPKKARPKKILSQECGPNVTTIISCPKFLLPPDERSDMQVTCFRQTLSPSMHSLITAESISSCKALFLTNLCCPPPLPSLVPICWWTHHLEMLWKILVTKKKKKSFGASSARVCSKASCGLASQINVGKKNHGTRDRWPKKNPGLGQRGRSPISFSSPTSVVDRKEMRNALLIMYLCIVHM